MTKLDLIRLISEKILKKNHLNLISEPYLYMGNTIVLQIKNPKKLSISIEILYFEYMSDENPSVIIKKFIKELKYRIESIKNYYDYQR